jgi:hypothetical protein
MTPPPVGVVGLGVMGSAMSSHLLAAGFPVLGFDIDPGRRAEHEARGGTVCDSAADGARSADVVVTSLPSATALVDVLDGEGGLHGRGRPGLVVVETSTLSEESKRDGKRCSAVCGMRSRAWTRANSSGCSRRTCASASRPHSTCCSACRFSRTLDRRCSAKSVSPASRGKATVMSRTTTRSPSSGRSTQAAISRTQSGKGSWSCSPMKGSPSPKMRPPPRHAGPSPRAGGGRPVDPA